MTDRALTVKQPWADLIMAGSKDVENRSWPVPSTLPQWWRCERCGRSRTDASSFVHDGNHLSGHHVHPDGPFPFRLGIHAAKSATVHDYNRALLAVRGDGEASAWIRGWRENRDQPVGALLGTVEVTGCHHADECDGERDYSPGVVGMWLTQPQFCSRWAEPDAWHWTLTDPQPLETPIPMRGMLGLWRLPAEVTA